MCITSMKKEMLFQNPQIGVCVYVCVVDLRNENFIFVPEAREL